MDLESDVSPSFFQQHNIEKGLMTLVSQEEQEGLLQHIHSPYQNCGGSAANALIAMAHLGSKAFFSCKVAADYQGKLYLQNLKKYGIKSLPLGNNAESTLPTATCLVMITPDADRTMQTHLGIASELDANDIVPGELAASHYLFIEGYLASSPKGLQAAMEAMKQARTHSVKTVLSLCDPSMAKYFRPQLLEIIGDKKLDLLLCNAEEALLLAEQRELPAALQKLLSLSASVVVTRGSDGVLIREQKEEWSVPAPEVKAINTNGAGDLFAGAYLYALTQGHPPPRAGAFACLAASRLVTQPGARLEKEELKKLYAKFSQQK